MKPHRIAIVGLGVAGATAAALLAQQGHDVTVFEQCPEPTAVGAGIIVQPSGQLVLDRLGLLQRVIENAEPIDRLFAITHRGKTLIDLPYGELADGVRAYGVHRGDLFTALYDNLRQTSAKIRLGTRPINLHRSASGVQLLDEARQELGEFDFVLACDGARSALRAATSAPMRVLEYPHGAIWAIGRCEAIRGKLWQVTRGSRNLCGLLPMGGGRCSLFWSLEKCRHAALLARGFGSWRTEVLELCPLAAEIFETVRSFEEIRFTTYFHVRMPQPFDDRCLFLGDAAHAMSPHLGQGINLALIDAWCFGHAAVTSATCRQACENYTAVRRRHLRVYSAVTYLLSPFFQSRGRIKGILRDIFLPLMPKIPPLRRHMILTMSGLRAGFRGGKIVLPRKELPANIAVSATNNA